MPEDIYDFEAKRVWRGWVYNRICDRIPGPQRRESMGFYLAGTTDKDRAVALSKGFSHDNLIAVDRDDKSIAEVRSTGGIGVCADLLQAVKRIDRKTMIHFGIADLTCGFTSEAESLIRGLNACGDGKTVYAINMQRGRAGMDEGEILRLLSDYDLAIESCFDRFEWPNWLNPTSKHRGFIALTSRIIEFIQSVSFLHHEGKRFWVTEKFWAFVFNQVFKHARPELYSYWSPVGNCYFDTVVFTNWCGRDDVANDIASLELRRAVDNTSEWQKRRVGAKIAALQAVRTKARRKRKGDVSRINRCGPL